MRPAVKILTAKNERCHRRTYGTHRLIIVCLIRRKVQPAGTYRPMDETYTDCLHTWPNKLPESTAKYGHYKLAITHL